MSKLGAPWPDIQDAYLRAWEFRPTRAEALYPSPIGTASISATGSATCLPSSPPKSRFPNRTNCLSATDIYAWRATDEQAVCASWIGKHAEAFTLWRRLLARPDIPDNDRQRIAGNRDICAPTMIDAASSYPDALVQRLVAGPGEAEVVVSLVAGPDRASTEQTLNSFLNCCTDVSRVGRFLVLDAGLSAQDRAMLRERYGFLNLPRRPRRRARRPARADPRPDPRTVLAASGPGLAIFCTRELHHPPDRGARGRSTGIPGGHQLHRCGQAHRRLRGRGNGTPRTRCRPLRAHR